MEIVSLWRIQQPGGQRSSWSASPPSVKSAHIFIEESRRSFPVDEISRGWLIANGKTNALLGQVS
jgi:hypothetical protein